LYLATLVVQAGGWAALPPSADRAVPIAVTREGPLVPGERHSHTVTVTVNGDRPGQFFRPGQHFAVWNGSEIGHGVVSRRVFFS
jgi:hypothetical protein